MIQIRSKYLELIGDTVTPISVFLNLRDHYPEVALFESSDHHSKENSKSFICAKPMVKVSVRNQEVQTRINGKLAVMPSQQPLADLEKKLNEVQFLNEEVSAFNGFFGAVSYEAVPYFESISFSEKSRFEGIPEIYFASYEYLVVLDNFTNKVTLIMNSFSDEFDGLEVFQRIVFQNKMHSTHYGLEGQEESNETYDSIHGKIKKAKEYVRVGEVFQLVVSRGFRQRFSGDDFNVYRQLRTLNPSPYLFYFEMEQSKLIGASPEAQFRIKGDRAEIMPIAGTVKRTGDEMTDLKNSEHLAADQKENAEHTMLVDLARNDLNRTCEEVKVVADREIQRFSHVIHMVSRVAGKLTETSRLNAFVASFPAGTLSGAPKYRAMELIDELEAENRGFYGGAIGHLAANGDLNMAIIIRSALSHKNTLYYQAGAGIVMDSQPENEIQEIENKIGAVRKAIRSAEIKKYEEVTLNR